jgi:hypothetical protein
LSISGSPPGEDRAQGTRPPQVVPRENPLQINAIDEHAKIGHRCGASIRGFRYRWLSTRRKRLAFANL